jgi:putative ABC transport system permease protein
MFGGLMGIAVGLSLAWIGATVLRVPCTIEPSILFLAFAFSTLIGISSD